MAAEQQPCPRMQGQCEEKREEMFVCEHGRLDIYRESCSHQRQYSD